MFVVERIYNNMSINEFQNYIKDMHLAGNTTLRELEKQIKETLKNEVEQGYRDSITGERKSPNAKPVEHTIFFEVYYDNKGTRAVPKTLQALNNTSNTKAEIIESETYIGERCSSYIYKITTLQENNIIPHVFYNNGASSVYWKGESGIR